jgi:hypothetical protein
MASLQSRRASAHWRATLATDCESVSDSTTCESVSDSTDRVSVSDSCSFRMSLTYSDSPFPSRRPSRRRFSNLAERLSFSAHTPPWPLIASLSQTAPQSRPSFLIPPAFRAVGATIICQVHTRQSLTYSDSPAMPLALKMAILNLAKRLLIAEPLWPPTTSQSPYSDSTIRS